MHRPEDLHTVASGSEIVADLCIVGSGPGGLAIAQALASSRIRVLVLESGRLSEDERIDGLGSIESDGAPRELDQTRVRNRIFGGSTQTWKARCTSFADTDFEVRKWVPQSGWPIALADIEKYVDEAASFLGLGPNIYDERLFPLLGIAAPSPELDRRVLDPFFWQFCNNMEFPYGRPPYGPVQVGREFLRNPPANVRVLVNATVTHLNTDATGARLESLDVSSIEGTKIKVLSRVTVLCAGGIENARLLLASNRMQSGGVGNVHDIVGRYLMDHIRLEVGEFDLADAPVIQDRFDFYRVKAAAGNRAYLPGFVLSRGVQKEEKLLHCSTWVEQTVAADDPWPIARGLLRRNHSDRLRAMRVILGQVRFICGGLYRSIAKLRGIRHKPGKLALMCMTEQIPDRDSRITLSPQRDALGVPTCRVHWKVNERELETIVRTAEIVARALEGAKLPHVRLLDWVQQRRFRDAPVIDVAHPTGTTRMSVDARDGVVDANCKVHGVNGLYVAGTSVFPTAGHANPTLLLTALALRLGNHLKTTIFSDVPELRGVGRASTFDPPPVPAFVTKGRRVLVTGGTGKIGRPLVVELVRRGYKVLVITSRDAVDLPGVDVRKIDLLQTVEFASVMEGCDAVLHLGAELHDETKMQRVNAEATGALAAAAEAARVTFFGYASTVSVYGSPTTRTVIEETPVVDAPGAKYLTVPYLRTYGATKLAGERRIRDVARSVSYVIYRPTAVVDVDAIETMRSWGRGDRLRYGSRLTNHVYLGDVVQAMIWLMERSLFSKSRVDGKVDVFNLSDESTEFRTYGKVYREAYRVTGDTRFRSPTSLPTGYDLAREALRYRSSLLHPHYPFGMLRFPPRKLLDAGFRHPYGLKEFYRKAFESLRPDQ